MALLPAMMDSRSLTLATYNSRGFNAERQQFIKSLLSRCSVLFLQEHWLSDKQLPLLSNLDSNFVYAGVSGFGNSDILAGRPFGGCAILYRSDLSACVQVLDVHSNRVCAIRLTMDALNLLLICVYMPYEGADSMTEEFTEQLANIDSIMYNNSDCHVIVGGDFNVDLARNSLHTALLGSFCDNTALASVATHNLANIDYTYHFGMLRFSVLDHFLLSGTLCSTAVSRVSAVHDVDNTSDHEPVFMDLSLQVEFLQCSDRVYKSRIAWAKAGLAEISNYQVQLSSQLQGIIVPTEALSCTDVMCCDSSHIHAINNYANSIMGACLCAAECTLPRTSSRQQSRRMPGWSEYVQPLKEKSLFWHQLWVYCGRPHSGAVADCMRRSRASYHYAIRWARKNEEGIISERIAESMLSSDRNFWDEVKRIRSISVVSSKTVDGISDASRISKLFADNYRHLYNTISYDSGDLQCIINELNHKLAQEADVSVYVSNVSHVKAAVNRLKSHKNDGSTDLSSDHIIHACDDLHVHTALLFNAILVHGSLPNDFLYSTIVPIPKGRNVNVADSANFRGIAVCSVFGKLFDNIVLQQFSDSFHTSQLQFGFKAKSSTNLCTFVLKEAMSYYVKHQSSVFCTFLDATKAFDRINYCKLFRLLLKRDLPASVVRMLLFVYTNNFVRVSWCGLFSEYFLATNGVKQGGVLSPVLFCVYLDELLVSLSKANVGCFLGNSYVGALAYADDLVLIAPTASAMRRMLSICDAYAADYCMSFNAEKSKCLVILSNACRYLKPLLYDNAFSIGGNPIEFVSSFSHLGHIITDTLDDGPDITKKLGDFIGQVNNLLCFFGKLSSDVKARLFRSYCTSYFGSELWDLSHCNVSNFCTAWRKSIRRVWNLPYRSHCFLLPLLNQCFPIFDELCRRSLKFFQSCLVHNSDLVRSVAQYSIAEGRNDSPGGRNVLFVLRRYQCPPSFSVSNISVDQVVHTHVLKGYNEAQLCVSKFLFELISIRDNVLRFPVDFYPFDIAALIEFVCTS